MLSSPSKSNQPRAVATSRDGAGGGASDKKREEFLLFFGFAFFSVNGKKKKKGHQAAGSACDFSSFLSLSLSFSPLFVELLMS